MMYVAMFRAFYKYEKSQVKVGISSWNFWHIIIRNFGKLRILQKQFLLHIIMYFDIDPTLKESNALSYNSEISIGVIKLWKAALKTQKYSNYLNEFHEELPRLDKLHIFENDCLTVCWSLLKNVVSTIEL